MDGYAASTTAGPSTHPSPPQRSPPIPSDALSQRTSSKHATRDPWNNASSSPPSTPPNRRRSKTREKRKQPLRAYASAENNFDKRHSHGLSWSSTTRDSVVDNLLNSLDSFSKKDAPTEDELPDFGFDKQKYMFPDVVLPTLPTNRTARRARGHTHSSSLSMDYEPHTSMPSSPIRSSASAGGRRSNSSSSKEIRSLMNGNIHPSKPSMGSRASTDTQKAPVNGAYRAGSSAGGESGDDGPMEFNNPSIFDKSKKNWKRRSMSMDQIFADTVVSPGSVLDRGRPVPSVFSKYDANYDVAPEPSIPAGPRKKENPTATGPVFVNQSHKSTLRRITTQTDLRSVNNAQTPLSPTIPQSIRNQASDFVRMSNMGEIPQRPNTQGALPSPSLPPNAKNTPQPAQKEKPGFFKRIFGGGSSKATSSQPARSHTPVPPEAPTTAGRTSSSNGSHPRTGTRGSSKEGPMDTSQPPPSLNKKPSGFLRRRKKSASENPPVPPLPLGINNLKVTAAEPPSPSGSSLRKVMNPYLNNERAEDGPPGGKREDLSGLETQESSTEDSDNLEMFHSGYALPADAPPRKQSTVSRSSSKPKHSAENDGSPKTRMKIKKRKPEELLPVKTSFLLDTSTAVTPTVISPLTDLPLDDKVMPRPASRASTGDRILASGLEVDEKERKLSTASTVSSENLNDTNVKSSSLDEPDAMKPDRSTFQPSVEEIIFYNRALSIVPEMQSQRNSIKPLHTKTSATFSSSGIQSPTSPASQYHSATSLPLPNVLVDGGEANMPSAMADEGAEYRERARKIFEGDEEDVTKTEAASWLGESNTLSTRTLEAYMELFDFSGMNILAALRTLCAKMTLKGETQQFDRIIKALSARWCACNPKHGFKAQDVVHTICYSLILLNTDLHLAEIGDKMSRSAYVKNTLPTIKRVVLDAAPNAFDDTVKPAPLPSRPTLPWSQSSGSVPQLPNASVNPTIERASLDQERPNASKRLSIRPTLSRQDSEGPDSPADSGSNAFVNQPWYGNARGWEVEIESVLKSFFVAIKTEPLPLHRAPVPESTLAERNLSVANSIGGLKRSNSVVSKTASDTTSFHSKPVLKSMTMGFQSKYNRSRPKLYPSSTLNSSKTSFDDNNSVWSPAQSTFSKYSFSKTLTSASMQSLGFSPANDLKHSFGFASALSRAIIREDNVGVDNESASLSGPAAVLDDEALTLQGAPWAKEGLVQHRHHMDTLGKRTKDRNWTDCFAVISKGRLTLFAFNTSTKSASGGRKGQTSHRGGNRSAGLGGGQKVGGGDWTENAEQLEGFVLRQTIATTLPPPGYSKTRPHVWALSLPTGAVHLFQVGTAEIALEFMSSANYWSARSSKEPLSGGVSNVEYGWSDAVINSALVERPISPEVKAPPVSLQNRHTHSSSIGSISRPSVGSSLRTSLDTGFGSKVRLPGDKAHLADWQPPSQSMMPSQLLEVDQLKALTAYVGNVEAELAKHNELKNAIELAFSPRHANYSRAMSNWQRKSDYLLRENVKFQTYVDSLNAAQKAREKFYAKNDEGVGKGNVETDNVDVGTSATDVFVE